MPATKTPAPTPVSKAANDPIETPEKTMAWIHQHAERAPELSAFAERQFTERHLQQVRMMELEELLRQAHEEFDALRAPELHPVTITHVERRDELRVEVAGRGVGRLTVAVHPDVPLKKLRVGVCGLLTKQRNCLISANGKLADFSAVGRFERRVGRRRAIVEHRGEPVCATLSDELRHAELTKGDLIGFDADVSNVAFVKLSKPDHSQMFETQIPTDSFEELGGLDPIIHRLKRVVGFRLLHREVAERYRLRRRGGVLLIGPPGNGKTRLARCLANYLGQLRAGEPARFMSVMASQDNVMWFGQSEKNLRDRFDAAREAARTSPVVMFFDEFDAVARRRGSDFGHTASDRIENTLLALLDGVQQIDNLIVIAATNRADTLDPAIVRPGRLDQKILIGSPNRTAARAIHSPTPLLRRWCPSRSPLPGAAFEWRSWKVLRNSAHCAPTQTSRTRQRGTGNTFPSLARRASPQTSKPHRACPGGSRDFALLGVTRNKRLSSAESRKPLSADRQDWGKPSGVA